MSEFRPNDDALLRVKVTEVSGSSVEVSIPTRPAPEYLTVNAADLLARDVPGRDEIVDEVLQHARTVITQYVSTAEVWRYDRVVRAFAIMLGEIPEDAPEIPSPSEPGYDEWLRARGADIEKEQD